jgi:hypothetical protein
VDNCNNLHFTGLGAVDDQIIADWPKAHWELGEVFPLMTNAWVSRQFLKRFKYFCNQPIGGFCTISSNVLPSVIEIAFCVATE